MKDFEIEVHYRIYDNISDNYLTVRPDPDYPDGAVLLFAEPDQVKYWGEVRLSMPKRLAELAGKALIAAAKEKGEAA